MDDEVHVPLSRDQIRIMLDALRDHAPTEQDRERTATLVRTLQGAARMLDVELVR